jgi:hypothetical protein
MEKIKKALQSNPKMMALVNNPEVLKAMEKLRNDPSTDSR